MADRDVITKILDIQVKYGDAVKKIAEYQTQIDGVRKQQKELNEDLKEGRISQDEYQRSIQAGNLAMNQMRVAMNTITKSVNNQLIAETEQEGSLVQLRTEINNLNAAYDRLSQAEREGAKGEEMKEKINILTTELKNAEESTQRFYRNVGNYGSAMKGLQTEYDSLIQQLAGMKLAYQKLSEAEKKSQQGTALAKDIEKVSAAAKEAKKGIDEEKKAIEEAKASIEKTTTTSVSIESYLGQIKDQIVELTIEYKKLSEDAKNSEVGQEMKQRIVDLTEEAGRLKDTIDDTDAAVSNAASDTRGFDQLNGALSLAVDSFGLVTGAAAAFGIAGKDLEEVQTKLQAAIAMSNALTSVQTSLQKHSALMQGVVAVQAKMRAIAENLATSAQGKGVIVTKAATVAQKLFNAAAKANPIGLLIAGVTGAIAAVTGLIKVFNIFGGDSEKRKEQLKQEAKALDGLGKIYEQNTERLKAMGRSDAEVIASTIAGLKDLSDAWAAHYYSILELYDEDADEYKEALDKKNEANEKYRDKLEEANNVMIRMFAEEGEQQIADEMERVGALHTYKVTKINQEMQKWKELYKLVHTLDGTWTQIGQEQFDKRMDAIAERRIKEVDKEEEKKAEESRQKAAEERKKAAEKAAAEQKKRDEDYAREFQAAQDALLEILKEGYDKQLQAEKIAYDRSIKALEEKMAQYKTQSEYDVKMRKELQTQIEAQTTLHERRIAELQWTEKERQIKIAQELLQSKLEIVKQGTEEELKVKLNILESEYNHEKESIEKRIADGLLTEEQGNILKLNAEEAYRQNKLALDDEYDKLELERQKQVLQNEIEQLDIAETEKQLHRDGWRTMTDEEMEADRQRKLESIGGYEAEKLQMEEDAAQKNYEALMERGQLSTQTDAEWLAEQNAAKQEWLNKQVAINEAYVKNEQAKQQAVRAVTNGLVSLLEALGDENSTYAKMAKVITLAQIAIDTGRALSSGIASASALPFPANLAAIATTVATVLANVATAISTVKSAKFATGGKVNGPGSGTSDSIPAMLSNGEYVMTARATRLFEPLLAAMNGIGAGVPIQVANAYQSVDNAEMMTDSFKEAAREIKPVVSVVEITEAQERVDMIENLDNF